MATNISPSINKNESLVISTNQRTPTISVIVPVYKVEQYLAKCIESILNQTFTDFELLLIDDGSPDRSGEICDEYATIDSRIRVFHKENGGVSSARNLGLDNARGEWITFLDSDDWISLGFLSDLYLSLDLSPFVDFVHSINIEYNYLYEPSKNKRVNSYYDKKIFLPDEFSQYINLYVNIGGACSRLFKLSIILENKLYFDVDNSAYEDTVFTFDYLSRISGSVVLSLNSIYYYCFNKKHQNGESESTKVKNYKNFTDSSARGFRAIDRMLNSNKLSKISYKKAMIKYSDMYLYSLLLLPYYDVSSTKDTIEELRSFIRNNIFFSMVSYKMKIVLVLFKLLPYSLYSALIKHR